MRHHVVVIEPTDTRSLPRDARHERRVQVIRLRKAGRMYDEIAALTGLSRTGVFNICACYEAGGAEERPGPAQAGREAAAQRRAGSRDAPLHSGQVA